MVTPNFKKFDTLSLHAGQQPDPASAARHGPVVQDPPRITAVNVSRTVFKTLREVGIDRLIEVRDEPVDPPGVPLTKLEGEIGLRPVAPIRRIVEGLVAHERQRVEA